MFFLKQIVFKNLGLSLLNSYSAITQFKKSEKLWSVFDILQNPKYKPPNVRPSPLTKISFQANKYKPSKYKPRA